MKFWEVIVESVGSVLSATIPRISSRQIFNSTMESKSMGVSSNERAVSKLKGYFDLAKEEIAKGVRSEEWGLVDDAVVHYKNAVAILVEAKDCAILSQRNNCETEKVKDCYLKIVKWHKEISERLEVLSKRAASTSLSKQPQRNNSLRTRPTSKKVNSTLDMNAKNISFKGYEANLIDIINMTLVDRSPHVNWNDIAGLEKAKESLMEMVILPIKRRDLFTGLRRSARGLLLFGPPGNGKTMLAKAVASESEATFFNVSSSSLTSKWVGEAEKLVRTLFEVASLRHPSVIFIDEIDSIMSTRFVNEQDSSRRLKSEFLVQFDGVISNPDDLIIVIGATNRPQELDDAVLRRLVKRIYIPLPDEKARRVLFRQKLKDKAFHISDGDLERLVDETGGYSGSDLQALCEEAAMMPIRELGSRVLTVKSNEIRAATYQDLHKALAVIRPSFNRRKWEELEQWNVAFGSN